MCKNFHKSQLLIPTVLISAELIVRLSQADWNEKNVFEVSGRHFLIFLATIKGANYSTNWKQSKKLRAEIRDRVCVVIKMIIFLENDDNQKW